jgi:zinc protease
VTRPTVARDRLRADSARSPQLPEAWRAAKLPAHVATLDNGLTVIAHRDRKAPIVAVYVAYHAGSRDEASGKSGLAHLFEHLMFEGTRQFPGNTFRRLERLGATGVNAISREDYTAYFATVPKSSLDDALAIEAARMSGGAFDEAELNRQREVVRNELLQRASEPYGSINRIIAQAAYPRDHPYSHPADGLIEELGHLAFADAIGWRRTHYYPANATLVIAGDIEPAEAIARTRRHFGKIASGAVRNFPLAPTIAKLEQSRRRVVADRAAASRIYLVWNVPRLSAPEYPGLELLIKIIAGGLNSRLWRSLVEGRHLASEVGGELRGREFGSQVVLWATAPDPALTPKLEKAMRAEIRQFGESPPASAELDRARFGHFAQLLRDTERLCGPRSKVELLGSAWIMTGDPNAHENRLARIASIRPRDLCDLAQTWLGENALMIEARTSATQPVRRGKHAVPRTLTMIRRTRQPRLSQRSAMHLPAVAISRRGSRFCEVRLVIDGGSVQDPPGRSGLAGVVIAALTDTAARHGVMTAAARLERLGAQLDARVRLDANIVRLSALETTITDALDTLHEVVDRRLDDATVERAKTARLVLIRSEKSRPFDLALRILAPLVYGGNHRYARPPSGIASEVAQISSEEVRALIAAWRTESTARLIVVGPHPQKKLRELGDRVGAIFSRDGTSGTTPAATPIVQIAHPRVVLIDQPGRSQSAIFATRAIGPRSSSDFAGLTAADTILGGYFTSRLNLNLREAKGWSYGARTLIASDRDAGLWLAHAFVAPERTVAAMTEVEREWRAIVRVTPSELRHATDYLTLRSAAERETAAQLAAEEEDLTVFQLRRSWYRDFSARLRALCPRDVADACDALVRQPLAWMIVGDATSITPTIAAAGFGAVEVIRDPARIP